ncbi:MAG TPA: type II toxin-antitoxin system VapC family toxin [Myxococcales bacterium]|jgi:predicted nucleic acid-binding protein|nr:type II toxin-antitoxin system VapC family toxin [Myxococcales bacterium]
MIAVLDTSVLIDHLRADPRAVGLLRRHAAAGDQLWSVTPVRTEILAGMRAREEAPTRALLGALSWQPVTIEIADRAGELARRYIRSHAGVDTVDYLLAAAAQVLKGELLTTNVRHFPMFQGLQPAYR